MKKIITLLFVFFTTVSLYAQNRGSDSPKLQLSKEKTDTGKIQQLIEMGRRFGFGSQRNDSAFWYSQQALDLSIKINNKKDELNARYNMANYLLQTGNYPEALKLSLQNINKAKQYHLNRELFLQTRLTGWIYAEMGDYNRELEYERKLGSLAQSKAFVDSPGVYLWIANNCMVISFSDLKMRDSALHYMHLGYNSALEKKRSWVTITCCCQLRKFLFRRQK